MSALRAALRMAPSTTSLLGLILLASLLAACGGGGPSTPASPQPTLPPSPVVRDTPAPPSGTPATEQIIDLASEAPASVIWGADTGDFLNDLPALASGDINGDGLDDVLIGARFGDGPENAREDSGEAYVVFGSRELPDSVDLAGGEQGLTVYGGAANDQLGFAGVIADVNGDRLEDVLLGAPLAQRPDDRADAGAVYVLFGGPDLSGAIDLAETPADLTLLGADGSDFFGDSLASTDVNGDEVADIIVGATFARRPLDSEQGGMQAGAAYAIFGSSDLAGVRDMVQGQYDVAIYGAEQFDEVGDNVAAGDVNGDGVGDIIVTAEAADGPDNARSVAAEVYVVYGSPDLGGVLDIDQNDQDVTVFGAEDNDTIGFNIASGDVSGDGVDDILMTARLADGPGDSIGEAGEVHIVLGGDALPQTIDLAADESDAYIFGPDRADMLGASLGVADLNGDGRDELLTGTGFAGGPNNSRSDGGEAYVLDASGLQGAVSIFATPLKLVIYGAQPGDRLGAAMTAGDLDGDGAPELILLAMEGDGPEGGRPDAGQIYVLKP